MMIKLPFILSHHCACAPGNPGTSQVTARFKFLMALSKPVFFGPEDCGCQEGLFDFYDQVKARKDAVKFMQNHHLIDKDYNCERCGQKCCLDTIRFYWRCQKKVSVNKKAYKKCNTNSVLLKVR